MLFTPIEAWTTHVFNGVLYSDAENAEIQAGLEAEDWRTSAPNLRLIHTAAEEMSFLTDRMRNLTGIHCRVTAPPHQLSQVSLTPPKSAPGRPRTHEINYISRVSWD